jgi:serine/threonine-protein kinase
VLKRVLQERASDLQFLRMFLDEARLAAQLQHPNIAQVYDVGRLGDSYFFTMEYVHGVTLRELVHGAAGSTDADRCRARDRRRCRGGCITRTSASASMASPLASCIAMCRRRT